MENIVFHPTFSQNSQFDDPSSNYKAIARGVLGTCNPPSSVGFFFVKLSEFPPSPPLLPTPSKISEAVKIGMAVKLL